MVSKAEFKKTFYWAVKQSKVASEELKQKILTGGHDRMENFVERLRNEVHKAQMFLAIKRGTGAKQKYIDEIVCDMVDIWLMGIEKENEKRIMSDVKRKQLEKEESDKKEWEAAAKGELVGDLGDELKEAGVVLDEKQVGHR